MSDARSISALNQATSAEPDCALSHPSSLRTAFGNTDIGTVRSNNEDNFLIDEALGLFMVADGMGGHAAGEIASAGALTALRHFVSQHLTDASDQENGLPAQAQQQDADTGKKFSSIDPDATWSDPALHAVSLLYDAIEFANHQLYAQNLERNCLEGRGMGTTLTGVWHPASCVAMIFFHVGDSRLYLQRNGQLKQLSQDQTLYQQALDAGMIANLPARNLLLQAMGPSPRVTPQVRSYLMQPDDVLMLCSDGLHGSVPHGEVEQVLADATAATLEAACAQLIALAKEYGSRDNITVLLVGYQ